MNYQYAKRMKHLRGSEVRELLKVTQNKNIISFGGGLPAPELFPVQEIMEVSRLVLAESGSDALQYTTTEGYLPLRRWISERMNSTMGTGFTPDNILITSGSQQGLDITGKVFLDEGDAVLCESPTYLSAISAFRAYGCTFTEIPTDDNGMIPAELEAAIRGTPRAKLIYVIPTFQNPSGRCWSLERRQELIRLSREYGIPVIEDNPYGELRFEGSDIPAAVSLDTDGGVIYLGTFSKIFCPGYRIGWAAGDRAVIEKYVLVKQGADLQCNTLSQYEISRYLELYDIDSHIRKIREVYGRRRNLAISILERELPPGIRFTRPEGGLFLWIELPEHINARELLARCLERNVAFVPGGSFFPNGGHENTMRINFSNMPDEKIETGLSILGEEIRRMVEQENQV